MSTKVISGKAVAEHNSRESCWIIVHGEFHDVIASIQGECGSEEEANMIEGWLPSAAFLHCGCLDSY